LDVGIGRPRSLCPGFTGGVAVAAVERQGADVVDQTDRVDGVEGWGRPGRVHMARELAVLVGS